MKKLCCVTWLLVSAAVLTSCSMMDNLIQKTDENAPSFINPHTDCAGCHGNQAPRAGKDLFPQGVEPSMVCFNCHKYKENHHPVDFAPDATANYQFPLYSGEIKCLTCHEIHDSTGHGDASKLLRGGPYADRRKICFKCHEAEQYADINPHIMFDDNGKTLAVNGKPVCLLCHAVKPNPYQDRGANVRFKAEVGFLCWRCHPPMPDSFLRKHFLVTPSEETLSSMQESEARLEIILPLAALGRITCSTCHNPHQKGIVTFADAAKGADAPKKLRASFMCGACHKY